MRTTVQSMPKRFCATCPTTMFVLSPFVATTIASASSMPASRSTFASIPWPTMNPPGQSSPSRPSASSASSIAVTSQPAFASFFATFDPTLPQPTTIAFTPSVYAYFLFLQDPLGVGDDHHLARRMAQDVVHGRAEEPRLSPPARRRADHDQIGAPVGRRFDDRLADRTRAHDDALDRDAQLGRHQLR